MRNLWPEPFTVCLFFVIGQVSTERIACRNCEGYQICGLKTSQTPDCPNGFPCTKEEYQLCSKITVDREVEKCDRPGVFAESTSPNNFYLCRIKDKSMRWEKKRITCPENAIFDRSTMRCLSENERSLLEAAKELTVGYRNIQFKFNCIKPGTFPNPNDCKMYHVCNSKLESQDFYCPLGYYFNGTNCSTKNAKQCIQQYRKQFRNQISQAKGLFQNVKNLLAKTTPTQRKFKSSATVIAPGVIKKTFYDKNDTKYTYYGIKKSSDSSEQNKTEESMNDFEKFIENIIAQYEMEKNSSGILSQLKYASEYMTGTHVQNATLVATQSGRKLCKTQNKTDNVNKPKKKIILNKVTIIFITQNNCESCSSNQTTAKPFAAENILKTTISQERATYSNNKQSKLETNGTLKVTIVTDQIGKSATTPQILHPYNTNNIKYSVKESTYKYPHVSEPPHLVITTFAGQDVHSSSVFESETSATLNMNTTSEDSIAESSTDLKATISSEEIYSHKITSDSETEITLAKERTGWHSLTSTSSEFEDVTFPTQDSSRPSKLETDEQSTASQYSDQDLITHFTGSTFADQGLPNSVLTKSVTPSALNKITTSRNTSTQETTALIGAVTNNTASESTTKSSLMKTSTSQHSDTIATTESIETSDGLDLVPIVITSETSSSHYSDADWVTQSVDLNSNSAGQEYSGGVASDLERESNILEQTFDAGSSSPIEQSLIHQGFSKGVTPDSLQESTLIKTSTSGGYEKYSSIHSEETTFSNQELPTASDSSPTLGQMASKDQRISGSLDSETSAGQYSDEHLFTKFAETTSVNEGLSGSPPFESGTSSASIKISTVRDSSTQKQQIIALDGVVSTSAAFDSTAESTLMKTSVSQFSDLESASEYMGTTSANHEFPLSTASDLDKENLLLKTSANPWNFNTYPMPLITETISRDQEISNIIPPESKKESVLIESSDSQYSDTVLNTQSLETNFSDQEPLTDKVSESEWDNAEIKVSTSEPFYTDEELYFGVETSVMTNINLPSTKNYHDAFPQSLDTLSGDRPPLNEGTDQFDFETTKLETGVTDVFFSKETEFERATASNVKLPSDFISIPQLEDGISSFQNIDLGLEIALKNMSTSQNSNGGDYPDIKGTTPIIHNTKLDSEPATTSTTNPPFTFSTSANSNKATFLVQNIYQGSTSVPELANPSFIGASKNSETSPFDLKETTLSNLDFFHSSTQEKKTGKTTLTSQHSDTDLFIELQNTTFTTQDLSISTTLSPDASETPIKNNLNSEIGASELTQPTSFNGTPFGGTIAEAELEALSTIESSAQNFSTSITPYAKEKNSAIQSSLSGPTQKSEANTAPKDTSTSIPFTLSSPYEEVTNSVVQKLQNGEIVESETETLKMTVSTPLLPDISKPFNSKLTPPTANFYGESVGKSEMTTSFTGTGFVQIPFINTFYSRETISPTQVLFGSAILEPEKGAGTNKITSGYYPHTKQYTYVESTTTAMQDLLSTITPKPETINNPTKFSTGQDIDVDVFTSSDKNFYTSQPPQTTATIYSNENIDGVTPQSDRGTVKMKITSHESFHSSAFPESTAENSINQGQYITPSLEEIMVTSKRTSIDQQTDATIRPQPSTPKQELLRDTVFSLETGSALGKANSSGQFPQSPHSTLDIKTMYTSTNGEPGEETITLINSTTEILEGGTFPESIKTTASDQEYMSTAGIKSGTETTLNTINKSQHIEINFTAPQKHGTIIEMEDIQNTSSEKSKADPFTKLSTSSESEGSFMQATDTTSSDKDYGSVDSNKETATVLIKGSTYHDFGTDSFVDSAISNQIQPIPVQPIEEVSDYEEHSKSGALYSEMDTNLKETSTTRHSSTSSTSHLVGTTQDTNRPSELLSETEYTIKNIDISENSDVDSFIQFTEITLADQELSSNYLSDHTTESSFMDTSTKKYPEIHSPNQFEKMSLINQELQDSSNTSQFSYTDSSSIFMKTTSAEEIISSEAVSGSETKFIVSKINTTQFPNAYPTSKFTEMASTNQQFSSGAASDSKEKSTLMKTSTSQHSDTIATTESIQISDSSSPHLETEVTVLKTNINEDSLTQAGDLNSAGQEYSSSVASDLEKGSDAMKTQTKEYYDANSLVKESIFSQELSSVESSSSAIETTMTKIASSHFSGKNSSTELFVTTSAGEKLSSSTTSDIDAESTVMKNIVNQYFDTVRSTETNDGADSNLELESETVSIITESEINSVAENINSNQYFDVDSSIQSTEATFSNSLMPSNPSLQSETDSSSLMEYSTTLYSDNVSSIHSESSLYVLKDLISSQNAYITYLESERTTSAETKEEINSSISSGSEYADTGSSTQSKEMPFSNVVFSGDAVSDPGVGNISSKTDTGSSFISPTLQPQSTTSTTESIHRKSTLESETEITRAKVTLNQQPNIDLSTQSSMSTYSGSVAPESKTETVLTQTNDEYFYIGASSQFQNSATAARETRPTPASQITFSEVNTNQHSVHPQLTSTESISRTQSPLTKTSVKPYTSEEVFKSTASDSEIEFTIMENLEINREDSMNGYLDTDAPTKDRETTSSDNAISSGTNSDLEAKLTYSKTSTSSYFDTDFVTESKQVTLSHEALSNTETLKPKKEVTLMKTTTSRHPYISLSPELENTTFGIDDVQNVHYSNSVLESGTDGIYTESVTDRFPDNDSFALHFKTTSADQGITGMTGSELETDPTVNQMNVGNPLIGASLQYVDTFSTLDTETKNSLPQISTDEHPYISFSQLPNSTPVNPQGSINTDSYAESTLTKINVGEPLYLNPNFQPEGTTYKSQNLDISTRIDSETRTTETEIKTSQNNDVSKSYHSGTYTIKTKEITQKLAPTSSQKLQNLPSTYGSTTVGLDEETISAKITLEQQSAIDLFTRPIKMTSSNQELLTAITSDSEMEATPTETSTQHSQLIKPTSSNQGFSNSIVLESGTSVPETNIILQPYISASSQIETITSAAQHTENDLTLESETETKTIHSKVNSQQYSVLDATPQSNEIISPNKDFFNSTVLQSETEVRELLGKSTTSRNSDISGTAQLEGSTFAPKDISSNPPIESEEESMSMKTSTGQHSDVDRLSQTFADRYTSHSLLQSPFTPTSYIPNLQISTGTESETTKVEKNTNQYLQTNTPLFKITPKTQISYSSPLIANDLTNSLPIKSTSPDFFSNSKKTTLVQNVNTNMNVDSKISVASKKTNAGSTPIHSERVTATESATTFPDSYKDSSPDSRATASQTHHFYSTSQLNSERETVPTKANTTENPDATSGIIFPSVKTSTAKASPANYGNFSDLPHLKEITFPVQNIDRVTTEGSGTKTGSMKYSIVETFHATTANPTKLGSHNFNTSILESETISFIDHQISASQSKKNTSRTTESYSTPASSLQLASMTTLKKINTSLEGDASSFHPKATTSVPQVLDVSMRVESETAAILTKTNTSQSPDFSTTTDLKSATSPTQEMKTVSKNSSVIKPILSSITLPSETTATATAATSSQHPHMSTFIYTKGINSQIQNIDRSTRVKSESTTLPKKASTTDYLNFSVSQTQNNDLGPRPQSLTTITLGKISTYLHLKTTPSIIPDIPNGSEIESETTASKPKTNTTKLSYFNSEQKTSVAENFSGSTPLKSERETESAKTAAVSIFYSTSKPSSKKVTVPTSVTEHLNANITSHLTVTNFPAQYFFDDKISNRLSSAPSSNSISSLPHSSRAPYNIISNSPANITSNSTFQYSYSTVIPRSKETVFPPTPNILGNPMYKMSTFPEKETSFSRAIHISTTLKPTRNSNNLKKNFKKNSKKNLKNKFRKKKTKSFRCSHIGLFRDPNDCHSYYRCKLVPDETKECLNCKPKRYKLVATHKKCEDGKWFSALFWWCIKIRPLLC